MEKSRRPCRRSHNQMRIERGKLRSRSYGHGHRWGGHAHRSHRNGRLLVDDGLREARHLAAIPRGTRQRRVDGIMAHVASCATHQLSVGHVRQSKSVWCWVHYQHAAAVHNRWVRRGLCVSSPRVVLLEHWRTRRQDRRSKETFHEDSEPVAFSGGILVPRRPFFFFASQSSFRDCRLLTEVWYVRGASCRLYSGIYTHEYR